MTRHIALVICALLVSPLVAAEQAKPLGASFHLYQTITFTDEIVWPLDLYADTYWEREDPEQQIDRIERYHTYMVGRGSAARLSPEHIERLGQWVAGGGNLIITGDEGRKLFERGYTHVSCKAMDEFGPDKADEYIETASVMQKAGFLMYTTAYNFMFNAEAVRKIAPHMDLWQSELLAIPYPQTAAKRFDITISPRAQFWSTFASSVWGNYIDYPRPTAWACAYARLDGMHTHGYMRWLWTDHSGAIPGPKRVYDSVAVVAYGNSVISARYLASLLSMIDQAKTAGVNVDDIQRDLAAVISTDEKAILPVHLQPSGLAKRQGEEDVFLVDVTKMGFDPATYRQAKRRVMELTLRLAERLGPGLPHVRHGDWLLIDRGNVRCSFVAGDTPDALRPLVERIAAKTGTTLAIGKTASHAQPLMVLAGTLDGCEPLRQLIASHAPGRVTDTYPRPGHYAIVKIDTDADRRAVLIVGGDREGVDKGVNAMVRTITAEKRW